MRPATRTLLRGELERVVEGVAAAHGVAASVRYSDDTPSVINDATAAGYARRAAAGLLGADAVVPLVPAEESICVGAAVLAESARQASKVLDEGCGTG